MALMVVVAIVGIVVRALVLDPLMLSPMWRNRFSMEVRAL